METWGVWDNFEDGFIDGPFTTERESGYSCCDRV